MNSVLLDVEDFGQNLSNKELEKLVLAQNQKSLSALKELFRRKAPNSQKIAERVMNFQSYDRRMKLTAANFLGKTHSSSGIRCLCKSLNQIDDKGLRRKVIQSLGRIGDLDALKELEEIKTREATFARRLISYRNHLKGYDIPPIVNKSFSKRNKNVEISLRKISPAKKSKLNAIIKEGPITFSNYQNPVLELNCFGQLLYLFQPEDFFRGNFIERLLGYPDIPMQVYSLGHCPDEAFLSYYVMTHPMKKKNHLKINLVTTTGNVAYSGVVIIEGEQIQFSIGTANKSIFPPTLIKGFYLPKSNKFEFDEVLSQLKLDNEMQKTPQKLKWQ